MIKELNEIIVGFDLGRDFSQITFYNHKNTEPVTVRTVEGQEKYLIQTPKDLFPLVEENVELGLTLLSNFFKECFTMISASDPGKQIRIMVTMDKMEVPWTNSIPEALSMLGIKRERVHLQDHRESFFCYTLNQKKELWNYKVALFEYDDTKITAYELSINYKTRPALVTVTQMADLNLDKEVRGKMKDEEWNEQRDNSFLELIQYVFENKTFSSIFLIGDNFDKTWAVQSLRYLCNKRHVFQGRNLFTKGACYGAMMKAGTTKIGDFLYVSEAMVEVNVGMQMIIRGKDSYYICINAGINWYEAYHTCEFILDGTQEITLFTKPIDGSPAKSHSILLEGLPKRPNKTTRIQLQVSFLSAHQCKAWVKDMGFGELYPAKGHSLEIILDV